MAHWGSFSELLASFSVPLQETAERCEYAADHHVDAKSCAEGSNVEGVNNTGSLPDYGTFHEDLPQFVYESPFSGSGDGHTSSSMGEEFRSAGIDLDWSGLEEDPDADCLFSNSDSGSDDEAEIPVGDTDNVDLRGDDNPRCENPDGVEHSTARASYERHAPEATPYERRKRHPKDAVLPEFRPSRSMGAVEIALWRAAGNPPEHIFLPTAGMVFDSCTEAYEFYNLYSWEVGFGIRYGNSFRNHKNKYQTMQQFECTNAVQDPVAEVPLSSKTQVAPHGRPWKPLSAMTKWCREKEPVMGYYRKRCNKLKSGVSTTLPAFMTDGCRKYNSGVFTAHYARWYEGPSLLRPIASSGLFDTRTGLRYQIMMGENSAELPDEFYSL